MYERLYGLLDEWIKIDPLGLRLFCHYNFTLKFATKAVLYILFYLLLCECTFIEDGLGQLLPDYTNSRIVNEALPAELVGGENDKTGQHWLICGRENSGDCSGGINYINHSWCTFLKV